MHAYYYNNYCNQFDDSRNSHCSRGGRATCTYLTGGKKKPRADPFGTKRGRRERRAKTTVIRFLEANTRATQRKGVLLQRESRIILLLLLRRYHYRRGPPENEKCDNGRPRNPRRGAYAALQFSTLVVPVASSPTLLNYDI